MKRVVITGLGVVSPIGTGQAAFWHGLAAGRSGIGPITLFDASRFPVRIGGEARDCGLRIADCRWPMEKSLRARGVLRDRKVLLGMIAAEEAVRDAGLDAVLLREGQVHVGVSLESFFLEDLTPAARAPDMTAALVERFKADRDGRPLQVPLDTLGWLVGERYGILGGRFTNCSACAAGAQAIGEALRAVQEGAAKVAIAGAADSMLNPLGLGGFSLLRILSAENDDPVRACRPFDATRQGTVLGEGAAFLVLEEREQALARGARIYAELIGYGSSMDAFRVSDPEPGGRGAVLAMTRAIRDARLEPGEIDCVNAHGTGTPKNDIVETGAIKEVLGPRARQIPVHAVKSMTGHLIAASGAVEAVAAVLTLHCKTVPPTMNLATPDPECDLDYVPGRARAFAGRTVLSNSFGFGGQNATLVFRAEDDRRTVATRAAGDPGDSLGST